MEDKKEKIHRAYIDKPKKEKIHRPYRGIILKSRLERCEAREAIEVKIVPIKNKELHLILSSFMEIGKEEREIAFDILKILDNISETKAITILELCNKCIGNY